MTEAHKSLQTHLPYLPYLLYLVIPITPPHSLTRSDLRPARGVRQRSMYVITHLILLAYCMLGEKSVRGIQKKKDLFRKRGNSCEPKAEFFFLGS